MSLKVQKPLSAYCLKEPPDVCCSVSGILTRVWRLPSLALARASRESTYSLGLSSSPISKWKGSIVGPSEILRWEIQKEAYFIPDSITDRNKIQATPGLLTFSSLFYHGGPSMCVHLPVGPSTILCSSVLLASAHCSGSVSHPSESSQNSRWRSCCGVGQPEGRQITS